MYRQSERNLLNKISPPDVPTIWRTQPTNGWDWLAGLGAPQEMSTGSRLGFIEATSFTGSRPCWSFPVLVQYTYIFRVFCPLMEFCQVQTSLCVQVLRSPILAALLHGTRPVGVNQTLRRGIRNGISELSQTAPPIFGWAAITLGIGPHSSL